MCAQQNSRRSSNDTSHADRNEALANGLGWFSIGLGLAEVFTPGALANLIGTDDTPKTRNLLRFYGTRELAAGVGILTQEQPAGWMWARVAGDAVDLSSLAAAMGRSGADKGRLGFALASVAGVTALDVYCARQLSDGRTETRQRPATRVTRSIIVDKPVSEVYQFWRNFENLPRFMEYLESVQSTGDRRTHWVAVGPAGFRMEWDAEITHDELNRRIGWRATETASFEHTGEVRFEPAPGDRGTLLTVEWDYSRSRMASLLGKLMQMDLGRRVMHDLRQFKQVLEVGEVTKSDASIHTGMHAAQPAEQVEGERSAT